MNHKLDTDTQVFFYEQDFYVLSNFSAFEVTYNGLTFKTSEHAYHAQKFNVDNGNEIHYNAYHMVVSAPSAHESFRLAQALKEWRRSDWDAVKIDIMYEILKAKVRQHEYVKRKLLATGDRELIEDSWRDDYWGWGPNKDGQNMLGKLWMKIRDELKKEAE